MLEHAVAVREPAIGRLHFHKARLAHIPGRQAVKAFLQLDAIGADVLHGRRAHGAGDQRQIFQAIPSLRDAGRHESMPALAASRFDDPRVRPRFQQPHTLEGHARNQAGHAFGQHHVAAAAQHEQRRRRLRQGGQRGQLRGLAQRDERIGPGCQSQRIQTSEVLHGRRQGIGRGSREGI